MNTKNTRLTATDWLDIALQVLAEGGFNAVAVEPLAKKLGVTKGSFYWHFKNRSILVTELLKFWEQIEDQYHQQLVNQELEPHGFLYAVLKLLIEDETNKRVFLALSNQPNVAEVQQCYQRAVDRRIEIFELAYINLGDDKVSAKRRAHVAYLAYLGLIKSLVDGSIEHDPQLVESLITSLIQPSKKQR